MATGDDSTFASRLKLPEHRAVLPVERGDRAVRRADDEARAGDRGGRRLRARALPLPEHPAGLARRARASGRRTCSRRACRRRSSAGTPCSSPSRAPRPASSRACRGGCRAGRGSLRVAAELGPARALGRLRLRMVADGCVAVGVCPGRRSHGVVSAGWVARRSAPRAIRRRSPCRAFPPACRARPGRTRRRRPRKRARRRDATARGVSSASRRRGAARRSLPAQLGT